MTKVIRKLHWTAIVGAACSFWLLFWLFCIAAALHDIKQLQAESAYSLEAVDSGYHSFMMLVGAFALWTMYRAAKRLSLMKHGRFQQAKLSRRTEESYHYDTGVRGKITTVTYHYTARNITYANNPPWYFRLRDKQKVNIVYHTLKPERSAIVSELRARFNPAANEWRSSIWHVIPRLTLLILIAAAILVLLLIDGSLLIDSNL